MNLTKSNIFTDVEVTHIFLDPWDERLYTFNSFHDRELLKNLNWQEFKQYKKPAKGNVSLGEKLCVLGALICVLAVFYFI